jgi:hypothetical protein
MTILANAKHEAVDSIVGALHDLTGGFNYKSVSL